MKFGLLLLFGISSAAFAQSPALVPGQLFQVDIYTIENGATFARPAIMEYVTDPAQMPPPSLRIENSYDPNSAMVFRDVGEPVMVNPEFQGNGEPGLGYGSVNRPFQNNYGFDQPPAVEPYGHPARSSPRRDSAPNPVAPSGGVAGAPSAETPSQQGQGDASGTAIVIGMSALDGLAKGFLWNKEDSHDLKMLLDQLNRVKAKSADLDARIARLKAQTNDLLLNAYRQNYAYTQKMTSADAIPTPQSDFQMMKETPELRARIKEMGEDVDKILDGEKRRRTQEIVQSLDAIAIQNYGQGKFESAREYVSLARDTVDIATKYVPFVGVGRAVIELVTAKNWVNGKTLEAKDAVASAVGLAVLMYKKDFHIKAAILIRQLWPQVLDTRFARATAAVAMKAPALIGAGLIMTEFSGDSRPGTRYDHLNPGQPMVFDYKLRTMLTPIWKGDDQPGSRFLGDKIISARIGDQFFDEVKGPVLVKYHSPEIALGTAEVGALTKWMTENPGADRGDFEIARSVRDQLLKTLTAPLPENPK